MDKGTTKTPGPRVTNRDHNAKNEDSLHPNPKEGGQDAEDVAERMGTTGKQLGTE